MHRIIMRIVCTFFVLNSQILYPQVYHKQIAVLNLDAVGVSINESIAMTDRLRSELVNSGVFMVIERSKMDEILNEQGFQMTGCTSDECAVKIGKLLNIHSICTGSIAKVGGLYTVSVRMIDVETGKILITANEDCRCKIEDVLTGSIKKIADKLATAVSQKEMGTLILKSTPPGMSISLNGKVIGKTPLEQKIPFGEYIFTISGHPYKSVEEKIFLNQAQLEKTITMHHALGKLQITNQTVSSALYLNGKRQEKGKSEYNLPVGEYRLRIERPGCETKSGKVLINYDKTSMFSGALTKKSKGKALLRSTILPGWGQAYQEKGIQKWIYPILFFSGIGLSYYSITMYNDAVDQYKNDRDVYLRAYALADINRYKKEMNQSYQDIDSKEKQRNIIFAVTGGIWLWNLIDVILLPPGYDGSVQLSSSGNNINLTAIFPLGH